MDKELTPLEALFVEETKNELKSLWIIKNKWVDIELFEKCKTLEAYNNRCTYEEQKLTQEEFDLLKEVLKND